MSYELLLLRLIYSLPILSVCINPLHAETLQTRQPPLVFSSEKVLETFFKELFETTTAGYTLYGQKPVDLEVFQALEKTIPGSKERRTSVIGLLALKYWNELTPNIKPQNYIFIDFPTPDGHEITLINRKAFLDVVKANSLLFEYKLGTNITPEFLLENLIQNGFSSQFKENIALQGIVLGYGVENSISYECGSSFLKLLTPKLAPPNQLPSASKTPDEVLQKIKDKNWAKKIQDLTCYRSTEKNDRLKIPFSFLKNSEKSKELLKSYRKYQNNLESVLNRQGLLAEVLQRFGAKKTNTPSTQTIKSTQLADFFTETERTYLPRIIAQTILNTFSDEISPSFIVGMNMAESKEQNKFEYTDIKFLDILWKRDKSALQPTKKFFSKISKDPDIQCLIPGELYTRTIKKSDSNKSLTDRHNTIQVQYLFKDLDDNPLLGSYELLAAPELHLSTLVPGLSHGLLGMKEGEVREIFIHPDFVYGSSSDFGKGQAVKVIVQLIRLGDIKENSSFPFLKPVDASNYATDIASCSEFIALQKKHAYACGLRTWTYYKQATPLITLDLIENEMAKAKTEPLSKSDNDLLLKLEWLLLQN